ncbi:MAG: SAM-dependent methyltransferase [Bacteroidota bacterium]
MTTKGVLYLIPTTLGDVEPDAVLPQEHRERVLSISTYIVEKERTARRFLKKLQPALTIDALTLYPLNKHTRPEEAERYLHACESGEDMGLLSEAGCPAVADPGARIVSMAHEKGIRVVPLVGPSSLLLALMASGLNGQSFAFRGYLPIDVNDRQKAIRHCEEQARNHDQTQLFIETPYRNGKLFEALLKHCQPATRVCVATDLTLPTETIRTKTVKAWRQQPLPDLHKRPTVFLLR